eukprot:COSAG04_NODE_5271_length_1678_cov_1.362888_1_plen_204_part_10
MNERWNQKRKCTEVVTRLTRPCGAGSRWYSEGATSSFIPAAPAASRGLHVSPPMSPPHRGRRSGRKRRRDPQRTRATTQIQRGPSINRRARAAGPPVAEPRARPAKLVASDGNGFATCADLAKTPETWLRRAWSTWRGRRLVSQWANERLGCEHAASMRGATVRGLLVRGEGEKRDAERRAAPPGHGRRSRGRARRGPASACVG